MSQLTVVKRDGRRVDFDRSRIAGAITKAFDAAGISNEAYDLDAIVDGIVAEIQSTYVEYSPDVESIQDIVERHLVKHDLYEVSKRYMLYRQSRHEAREREREERARRAAMGKLSVTKRSGEGESFRVSKVERFLLRLSVGIPDIDAKAIMAELQKNIHDGISTAEIERALILSTTAFMERDPGYNTLAARLLLNRVLRRAIGKSASDEERDGNYRMAFTSAIRRGVEAGHFDPTLLEFDLDRLAGALDLERDKLFRYIGLETLQERYFVRIDDRPIETPQGFWMRVAMGLAIHEENREERAIEFYNVLSSLRFVASTPTLFHAGLTHPQLSSCYLSTVKDDLSHIFKVISDNAQLSKWSGGIGNDWTSIRGTGSVIKSTNVESQGVIPFLKIASDTTVAINRSGKRRGATCAYLETWHLDIEDFLDLRRNTGDDRRRTHDMNTANWIPDLFMKRVREEGPWTLFSPDEVPDLHETFGAEFEKRYLAYEEKARNGEMRKFKSVEAVKLWRKMLTRLFETGHPWITFKDPSNIRSPQDHDGVVHNSNLCTEITLNNSEDETAVCNLGSINLRVHTTPEGVDADLLSRTVRTAMRMLDNVIDINFYPTEEARRSNMRHRPVGMGLMGFQDALFIRRIPFDSAEAADFADRTMELISYHAILASSELAKERGPYESYPGSKWDRGIFPIDSLQQLEEERGVPLDVDKTASLDWTPVRRHVAAHGMRNSNTMAIAPTATISNISGCYPCIEPIYKNIYVKSNMSGEFTVINEYLVNDLKERGLWGREMLERIKYYDGNISAIPEIPADLKPLYKEAFEIDPVDALTLTARRAKWIDQSQSHNVFIQGVSGKKLHETYMAAWEKGLKTTYYLRTLGASQIEKSTLDAKKYGYTQKRVYNNQPSADADAPTAAPIENDAPIESDQDGAFTPAEAPNVTATPARASSPAPAASAGAAAPTPTATPGAGPTATAGSNAGAAPAAAPPAPGGAANPLLGGGSKAQAAGGETAREETSSGGTGRTQTATAAGGAAPVPPPAPGGAGSNPLLAGTRGPAAGAGSTPSAAIPNLDIQGVVPASQVGNACSVLDPDCEACQ
ncbi:MAG: ribonucleoside-diphosphate reductase subunit alpha [Spirochaetaceae bacterium]